MTFLGADALSGFSVPFAALLSPVDFFLSPKARSQFFQNSGVVPVRTIGPLIDSASLSNRNSNHFKHTSDRELPLPTVARFRSLTLLRLSVKEP